MGRTGHCDLAFRSLGTCEIYGVVKRDPSPARFNSREARRGCDMHSCRADLRYVNRNCYACCFSTGDGQ